MNDKEIWRDIVGFTDRRFGGCYQVSDQGRVRNSRGQVLKLHTRARDGYVEVGLRDRGTRRTVKVHRLVAEAFLPNPEGLPDVDHINGRRSDNRACALRWASKSENGLNRHKAWSEAGVVGAHTSSSKANPFRSSVRHGGKLKHLGVFKTAQEASEARRAFLEGVPCG